MIALGAAVAALLAGAGFAAYRFGLTRGAPPLQGWLDAFAGRFRPARKEP